MLKPTIIRLHETASTNSYAAEMLLKARPREGTVIITEYQTRGKGTDTNSWESKKGMNLTFSLILYPDFAADQQFIFNKAIALGIHDFLSPELPDHKVTIKWPNDIYAGDKKICGILIQNSVMSNRLDYVVVGIGLNVNQTVFESDAPNPVSMKMATGKDYIPDEVLHPLVHSVFNRYTQVKPDTSLQVETDYRKALYRFLEWHNYLVKSTAVRARITGTSDYGQLLLETESGKCLVCDLKEVRFVI